MAADDRNEYFLPGDGIMPEVIQSDICRYLGNDAVVRTGEYQSQRGYFIKAYRYLIPEMISDLKEDSRRWVAEKKNLEQRSPYAPLPSYLSSNIHSDMTPAPQDHTTPVPVQVIRKLSVDPITSKDRTTPVPAQAKRKLFADSTISDDHSNVAEAPAKRKLFVDSTISDDQSNVAEAPANRKLFVTATISQDCTNSDARSSSLLSALKDKPRRLMIKSSGIETGDRKRIRLR